MKTEIVPSQCFPATDSSALKVAVIYEDFASGVRAKRFAEDLAQQLGGTCPLAESLWRCDLLEYPQIAAEAARAAAGCDYLIVALHANGVLALATRLWLGNQLEVAARCGTCLILLLNSGEENRETRWRAPGDARHQLRAVCAEKGVPFFCHTGAFSTDALAAGFRQRRETPAFELGRRLRTAVPVHTPPPQCSTP